MMRQLLARSWAFLFLLALVSLGSVLALSVQAFNATAAVILAGPERYDGQSVTLGGTVTNLSQRVSQRGNAYYMFDLQDATGRIRIFSFGQAPCSEGRQAVVDGRFDTMKRVGSYTFYNEITANRVTCR